MPAVAAVAVAIALVAPQSGPARPVVAGRTARETRLRQAAAPYLDAVAAYRAGGRARAVAAVLHWKGAERQASLEALHALAARPGECPGEAANISVRDLEGGALMLVDAALDAHQAGDRLTFAACVESGISELEWLRVQSQRPGGCADRRIGTRDFMLAVSRVLLGRFEPANAAVAAEMGLRAEKRDPDLLLAAGAAEESQGLGFSQYGGKWAEDTGAHRRLAKKRLLDAIAVAPDLLEARLRIGRLASLTGEGARARSELAAVARRSQDSGERYLARLFLGGELEREGDLAAAAREYEAAAATLPEAQAARLALAHVRGGLG